MQIPSWHNVTEYPPTATLTPYRQREGVLRTLIHTCDSVSPTSAARNQRTIFRVWFSCVLTGSRYVTQLPSFGFSFIKCYLEYFPPRLKFRVQAWNTVSMPVRSTVASTCSALATTS